MIYIIYRYLKTATSYNMPYTLNADTSVICQCACIVNKYYMNKHLQTAEHEREMVGRENIEVAEAWNHRPPRN
jgi:hypothetical protein